MFIDVACAWGGLATGNTELTAEWICWEWIARVAFYFFSLFYLLLCCFRNTTITCCIKIGDETKMELQSSETCDTMFTERYLAKAHHRVQTKSCIYPNVCDCMSVEWVRWTMRCGVASIHIHFYWIHVLLQLSVWRRFCCVLRSKRWIEAMQTTDKPIKLI